MAQVESVEYGEVFGVYILGFKKMDGTFKPDARRRKGIFLGTKRPGAMIVSHDKD